MRGFHLKTDLGKYRTDKASIQKWNNREILTAVESLDRDTWTVQTNAVYPGSLEIVRVPRACKIIGTRA